MRQRIAVLAARGLLLMMGVLAQEGAWASGPPTREEYFRFVPLTYPRLVRQTQASEALALFGDTADPNYRDEAPRDGIDDQRFRVLQALAVRFAPILVMNTYTFPMDHQVFRDPPGGLLLYLDTWDLAKPGAVLLRSDTLDFSALGHPCPTEGDPRAEASLDAARDDCHIVSLLREFRPDRPTLPALSQDAVSAEHDPFTVMYFDFPGYDPATWHDAYASPTPGRIARQYEGTQKTYAHPFLVEVRDAEHGLLGYELHLQFWFFYPFNAGGNNHEGDWEHLSAVISPLSAVERSLTQEEMRRILDGLWPMDGEDPLVLKRTEYFFHHNSMVFDFASPNAYLPHARWQERLDLRGEDHPGEKKLLKRVRSYVWADAKETRINTHPIGYIGADSKGLEQLLAAPGPHARESHATYPLPGVFKDVGPAGSTEAVPKHFDHQAFLSDPDRPLPRDVVRYDVPERITLVPDWERVYDLAIEDPGVRREWSWLILPLRWGYPSAKSPLAGIVAHADMGNLSITGPAYSEGWNRRAPNPGFTSYAPDELPWFFPLDVQDDFSNNLGFLNGPVAVLISLPPLDFIYRVLGLPVRALVERHVPVYTPQKRLPRRRVSVEAGLSIGLLDQDFAALLLNERQFNEWEPRLQSMDPTVGENGSPLVEPVVDTAVSATLKVSFYLGDRFTSENTLLHSRSTLGIDVPLSNGQGLFQLRSTLNMWEYAGSIRYNLLPGGFQPYLKAGYGLTWYRLEDGTINGVGMANPDSYWVRLPGFFRNLWPNTFHVGAGVDIILVNGIVPGLRGLDGGLRAGYVLSRHQLGIKNLTPPSLLADTVSESVHVYRNTFELLGTLSF